MRWLCLRVPGALSSLGMGVAGSQDSKIPFARNNLIEHNHVFDAMKVTIDGAGLYVTFAQLDQGCIVRGNLIHDTQGNRFATQGSTATTALGRTRPPPAFTWTDTAPEVTTRITSSTRILPPVRSSLTIRTPGKQTPGWITFSKRTDHHWKSSSRSCKPRPDWSRPISCPSGRWNRIPASIPF